MNRKPRTTLRDGTAHNEMSKYLYLLCNIKDIDHTAPSRRPIQIPQIVLPSKCPASGSMCQNCVAICSWDHHRAVLVSQFYGQMAEK